ncbi:MAG: spmA [Paenibacillaceae bacterium]|jgi:spore maturation protein A|nr:spmA [Paenibacillaceae bacterium]
MVNWIWLFFIVAGFAVAAYTGNIDSVTQAVFDGSKTGVTVSFGLISIMVFWLGIMRIAEDAGLLKRIASLLRPVVRWLFPSVPSDHPAMGYIMSNMSANILGLGNAATPMGIKAMQELQKLNPDKTKASAAMSTLLAINTASITLIPTTIIAIRLNFGSANAAEIVGTTLMATTIATVVALLTDKWYQRKHFPSSKG